MRNAILTALLVMAGCAAPSGGAASDRACDEAGIRRWFADWMKATREGDLGLARRLIADDAVFLVPGAGRMDKETFAAAATAADPNLDFDLDCSIEEIHLLGDHAWLRTKLAVAMTDRRSGSRSLMAGHSLSVLRREGDGWVVIRDANTVVPATSE